MNVTELARRLKIPTQELRDLLPKLGFDIGQRAIKIDDKLAHEIIKNWRRLIYEYNKKEEFRKKKEEQARIVQNMTVAEKTISLPAIMTVREFAALLSLPVNTVLAELMKNGIMASLNERIDYDTGAIVAGEFGYNVSLKEHSHDDIIDDHRLETILREQKQFGVERPPVIVIMGHVDHGKTKLLDTIRKSNVIATEAGGITQHIGAYQALRKDRVITFIDTPGHEAFTAMRSRGAKVADIAILIVAADDSVKPQTVEAIRIIQQSGIPMIVAINKIDKEEANIERVKTDLSQYNIMGEEWGGKTTIVPISALSGVGIEDLLDMILLTADLHKEEFKADYDRRAVGTIIESHVNKGEGIVATVLVQAGTLKVGDSVAINDVYYGKVRSMKDHAGIDVDHATPAKPVKIIGLKVQPKVGDVLEVPESLNTINKKVKKYQFERNQTSKILLHKRDEDIEHGKKMFSIIIRADVLGSLEAIIDSLDKIESEHIAVRIIAKGLGNITEADISLAQTSQALIIGFHTANQPHIETVARERGVAIVKYDIIYKLIEDIKARLEASLGDEIIRHDYGKLKILAIFKTEKKAMILGGRVIESEIVYEPTKLQTKIIVTRNGEYVCEGLLEALQSGKQNVPRVPAGSECGIRFAGRPEVQINDVLEFFSEEKKRRVL